MEGLKTQSLAFLSLGGEILIFITISIVLYFGLDKIIQLLWPSIDNNTGFSLSSYVSQCIAYGASIWLINTFIFKKSSFLTGFPGTKPLISVLKSGGVALLLLSLCFLILYESKLLGSVEIDWKPYQFWYLAVLILFQSGSEELMSRSFLQVAIETRFGAVSGVLGSAIVFFLLHATNHNVTNLALFNIFLAGVLFGVVLVLFRNFWLLLGFHAGWNFIQGVVFDFNVSGFDFTSMIEFDILKSNFITGGDFGPEGSVIVSVLLTLVIIILIWKYPIPELPLELEELT